MSTALSFEPTNYQPPAWEAIVDAHTRIAPRIHRTPILASMSLNALADARFFFKCENLQKTGSFKIRGAANAILSLSNEQAARGIVTQSSGNHGAAVACAAAWRGVPAYIVMPRNAPKVKIQAIEAYGGKITFCEPKVSSRKETCDRVQAETGAHLVHPYDDDRHRWASHCRQGIPRRNSGSGCRVRARKRWRTAQWNLPRCHRHSKGHSNHRLRACARRRRLPLSHHGNTAISGV